MRRMPRIVIHGRVAVHGPGVHGIPLDVDGVHPSLRDMSRETLNLICAELPGAEKNPGPNSRDLWTAGGRAFARVSDFGIEVATDTGWTALRRDASDQEIRAGVVDAYERLRHRLPAEDQPRLDRTSG